MILSATALDIARQQIGVHEEGGNNTGPQVDEYLRAVGLDPGYAWCAALVFWCFKAAAALTGQVNPVPKTASSQRLWTFSEPITRDSNPSVGAVFVLRHSATSGHVGICESIDADGVPTCISGNTYADARGGREGNCVARHTGSPETVHGGELLGWLQFDRAAQSPNVVG